MKKTYTEPRIVLIKLQTRKMLAGSLSGDGWSMNISNEGATDAAEGRESDGDWED